MRTRLASLAVVGPVVVPLAALLAGCGGHHLAVPAPNLAARALHQRSAAAADSSFTAGYDLDSTAGTQLAAVRVYFDPTAFRVDVVEKTATASLYGGTSRETVACTVASGIPSVCYDVAAPGAAIPAAFDAGVQRVFQRDLPAFAQSTDGLVIRAAGVDAALTGTAGGQCYAVALGGTSGSTSTSPSTSSSTSTAAQVDAGTYCLTAGGLLTGFVSSSGRLVLASHAGAPTAAELKVPATPQHLPAGLASASASTPAS